MAASSVIRIYIARQRYDAWLVADRLKQVGIRAHVFNQYASSIVGDLPADDVAQPQVWIEREADRERAEMYYGRSRRRARMPAVSSAPRAARIRPRNFELCWNCGKSLQT
jgi:hypothetical protein